MSLSAALLPEFDHEMATTRRTLERVTDSLFTWKPHAKSTSMGSLAGHLSNIPVWGPLAIERESFDLEPATGSARPKNPETVAGILETFDKNVVAARAAIAGATDEALHQPWSLLARGETIVTMPKIAVLRSFVMNHTIHHRAQLGVYLRLNDIPHPSMYGPSADEGM
jgi:uncharacterized damage-inducible protein DinB